VFVQCALTTAWSTTAGALPVCKFIRHLCPPWLMRSVRGLLVCGHLPALHAAFLDLV
jgi:hypothetical protein